MSDVRRIVFIEDEQTCGEVIRRLYEMCQKSFHGEVDFEVAGTWAEGLQAVTTHPPDVVLLDLNLPDSKQPQTEQHIAEKCDSWPPIIVLTGAEDKELRRRCILLGADDFMEKKTANRDPMQLCERIYSAHLRRQRSDAPAFSQMKPL